MLVPHGGPGGYGGEEVGGALRRGMLVAIRSCMLVAGSTRDQVGAVEGGSAGCTCSSAGERGCHTWMSHMDVAHGTWFCVGEDVGWRCNEEGFDNMSKR